MSNEVEAARAALERLAGPCPSCNGEPIREEVGQGEWRAGTCSACNGRGTARAAELVAEYKRGWNAARKAMQEAIPGTKR